MEKMDFLESYSTAKRAERRIKERIIEYKERQRTASAIKYTAMPKAHGAADLSDYICNVEDLLSELAKKMHESDHVKEAICHSLDSLDNQEEWDVLFLKHIKEMRMSKIASILHMDRSTAYRLYVRAVDHLVVSDVDVDLIECALSA